MLRSQYSPAILAGFKYASFLRGLGSAATDPRWVGYVFYRAGHVFFQPLVFDR
jgi:hypothetical protein